MNRRKFVSSFGSSTLFSALTLKNRGALAALNAAGSSLPNGQNPAAPGAAGLDANPVWPRPVIVPIPTEIAGVSPHVTDLAGAWKFSLLPPPEFWSNRVDPAGWTDVTVPGELTAQGMPIVRDCEYRLQAVNSHSRRARRVRRCSCALMAFTATRACG